ncbi:MAG: chromosomal replication initiator protein DnaA [bacterium]|nr:chromosomal replication initiator protein DnaA [bacterium]
MKRNEKHVAAARGGDAGAPLWRDILHLIEGGMSRQSLSLWIRPLRPLLVSSDTIVLEAPNTMHERIVEERYLDVLGRCARALTGTPFRICLVSAPAEPAAAAPAAARRAAAPPATVLNPDYTFESFVVGRCNRAAHAAALAAADRPGRRHNPLFITGGVGLGKTHLIQAIGARGEGRRPFIYVTSDQLMDDLMLAIENRTIARARRRLSSAGTLLVDDVHFLSGRNQVQEEFYAIFNALHERRGQIVLSSDRPPAEIPRLQQRLVSRFGGGAVIALNPPTLSTRLRILERKGARLGLALPRETLMLLASRIRTNIRRMEGALNRIAACAALSGGIPGTAEIERLLEDELLDDEGHAVTVGRIQARVAEHFGLRLSAILGKGRAGSVAHPRQLAMYLCRKLTGMAYADIGASFSGRDHSTVMHACGSVERLLRSSTDARQTANELAASVREVAPARRPRGASVAE